MYDYLNRARKLLDWIENSTAKYEDRRLPDNLAALQGLLDELRNFKQHDIPPKGREKEDLEEIYRRLQRLLAGTKEGNALEQLPSSTIQRAWDRLMDALRDRELQLLNEV